MKSFKTSQTELNNKIGNTIKHQNSLTILKTALVIILNVIVTYLFSQSYLPSKEDLEVFSLS